jgi:arabinose-5-phosphate isomerase
VTDVKPEEAEHKTPEPACPGGEHDLADCLARAREVLEIEAEAVGALSARLGPEFLSAVRLVLASTGRVVVTGVGKSGVVARKIAATLASTGTPALFLHPAEGVHGDLGMVVRGDVLVALSYSGATDELLAILPAMKRISVPIIAMTGRPDSSLAQYADSVLDVSVRREACPLNLAPTASTTAMLALGDALAVAAMCARKFTSEDYARLHPAGSLGRRLLLTAGDLMRTGEACPQVLETAQVREVIFAITAAHAGAAIVTDATEKLTGIITDGDIRRRLLKDEFCLDRTAADLMIRTPRCCGPEEMATACLDIMQHTARGIGEMPVIDDSGRPLGMLNLKDLLRAGIV